MSGRVLIVLMFWFWSLFASQATYAQFSGGDGTENNPYIITTPDQLAQLATYINSGITPFASPGICYKLGNDIDISIYGATFNNGEGWIPIGKNTNSFRGVFDGDNFTINNLYIDNLSLQHTGLFGFVNGGSIKNLGVEDVDIKSSYNIANYCTGGIVGYFYGSMSNCYLSGSINVIITAASLQAPTGGIVGDNNGNISNCFSTAKLIISSIEGSDAGGVAGHNYGTITNCYSTSDICIYSTGTNSTGTNYTSFAGGIAGKNFKNIFNCYSTSLVNIQELGKSAIVMGGIVGDNLGNVSNCVALNPGLYCTGNDIYILFGRIIGSNTNGTLSNNSAFCTMLNYEGNKIWDHKGENQTDGEDISFSEIYADGTLGGRFINQNNWIIEDGKLPGLSEEAVDMPAHLHLIPIYIKLSSTPSGGGAFTGDGIYYECDDVTINAIPNTGYNFINWTEQGAEVSTNPIYKFSAEFDRTFVANFLINTYSISVLANPPQGGNVSITGSGNYTHGESLTITAIPENDYAFVNWTIGAGGMEFSKQAEYTFTAFANLNLVANFVKTYAISVSANPTAGGNVSITGSGIYTHGQSVTITAISSIGYDFINWTEGTGGAEFTNQIEYSFTATANLDLVANFALKTYIISVSANTIAGGNVSITGSGTYIHGQSVTITAIASIGYDFINWTEGTGGTEFTNQIEYSFTATANLDLVANFALKTYIISVSANPTAGGNVSITGSGTYSHGQSVTITTTVSNGYDFINWTVGKGGPEFTNQTEYTFEATANLELVANFVLKTYIISVSANPSAGGSVSFSGSETYTHGESVTITATPKIEYYFVNWTVGTDMTEFSDQEEYTFTVTNNLDLVANFELKTYNITVVANPPEGGDVTISGNGTYTYGESVTITATVSNEFDFINWTVETDGMEFTTQKKFTFSATANLNLVANFALKTYNISVSANPSAGGNVFITAKGTYTHGQSVTITAVADMEYEFFNWTLKSDGTEFTKQAIYSFTAYSNLDLVANFVQKTYVITVSANPTEGGIVSINNNGIFTYGQSVTITAIAENEYYFKNWTIEKDGTEFTNLPEYNFAATTNLNLIANFISPTPSSYIVNVEVNNNSYGYTTGSGEYEIDAIAKVEAFVNSCYSFYCWKKEDVIVSFDNPYEFTVTENVNLVAIFKGLEFDTYAPILWNNTFMLNLVKLAEDGYEVSDCLWFKNGIEENDTHTINKFSYSAGANKENLLELAPTYYTFKIITKNNDIFCSEKKIIISYDLNNKTYETEDGEDAILTICPNPVKLNEPFTVEGFNENSLISIYNQTGAKVTSAITQENSITFNLFLNAGIYFIHCDNKVAVVVVIK